MRMSPGQLREQQRREFHPKFMPDAVNPSLSWTQEKERQADTQTETSQSRSAQAGNFMEAPLYICSDLVIYSAHCACTCTDVMPIFDLEPNQTRHEAETPFQGPLTSSKDVRLA